MKNAASNINATKEHVDKKNTQMTTQKKISKPSEDPVVAVRSLRLATTLSQVGQYYQKNIPDATSWLDVTESSLLNIRGALEDCRTLAVKGAQDSLSQTDRETIRTQLEKLQGAIFDEGNADYAGRTVFTGFRTDSNLTFTEDELKTSYDIKQSFKASESLKEHRYYDGVEKIPTTVDELAATDNIKDVVESDFYRIRLGYDKIDSNGLQSLKLTYGASSKYAGSEVEFARTETVDASGNVTYSYPAGMHITKTDNSVTPPATEEDDWIFNVYPNETAWANATPDTVGKELDPKEIIFIEETGEFIFGDDIASELMKNDMKVDTLYSKTGFDKGLLRPEYYYDCTKTADSMDVRVPTDYTKFNPDGTPINFDIQYTVAMGQTININTEASNVFDTSIQRDLGEMLNAVNASLAAHEKLDTLNAMKAESQYASEDCQKQLATWIEATKKEADFDRKSAAFFMRIFQSKIFSYTARNNRLLVVYETL